MENEVLEQWRPVKDYEGLYEVSDMGRVKSVERTCKRRNDGSMRRVKEKILKVGKGNRGHLTVSLSKNGVTKTWGVHVLVALAFPEICGEPFEGAQCNHIDENPLRNVPSNLNWLSPAQNSNHGTRNERMAKTLTNRPDLSKTVYQYTTANELVKEWQSTHEIERQTGWSNGNISQCCNGKRKTYKGYRWSYTRL